MHLHAYGGLVHRIDVDPAQQLPDLKDQVAEAVGQPVRRISRFMQLALIGAGRCAYKRSLPKDTAVYLGSSRGDLEITVDVMNHVFREGLFPKPLSFVNTVSNSAAFYVAKCLGLESRSSFISSRYFAFENALQLALIDMRMGVASSVLVGVVDSAVLPIDAHRERSELSAIAPLAEGSHWLWFTNDSASALGSVVDVVNAASREQLMRWVTALITKEPRTVLSCGQYLPHDDFQGICKASGALDTFDYRQGRGYYASQSGAAITEYLQGATASSLLHINRDSLGRYVAFTTKTVRSTFGSGYG